MRERLLCDKKYGNHFSDKIACASINKITQMINTNAKELDEGNYQNINKIIQKKVIIFGHFMSI